MLKGIGISNEGLSLTENAAHLGLPVPEKLKNVLEQLHGRNKEDNNMAIKGIDVSHWQGNIDWNKAKAAGLQEDNT
jgi:GH25 family lysozyme M1 (1,4-beta-N-acetylmuramidase)